MNESINSPYQHQEQLPRESGKELMKGREIPELGEAQNILETFRSLEQIPNLSDQELKVFLDNREIPQELRHAVFFRYRSVRDLKEVAKHSDSLSIEKEALRALALPDDLEDQLQVTDYPFAIELIAPQNTLAYLIEAESKQELRREGYRVDKNYNSRVRGLYNTSTEYFYHGGRRKTVPTILIADLSSKETTQRHERIHNETDTLEAAKLRSCSVSYRQALEAKDRLLDIYANSQEDAFESEEWTDIVEYINDALSDEILAAWDEGPESLESHINYVLSEDSASYNYLKRHLKFRGMESIDGKNEDEREENEVYNFMLGRYRQEALHNIRPAFQLHKFYMQQEAFKPRVEALGIALRLTPIADWNATLEEGDLLKEGREFIALQNLLEHMHSGNELTREQEQRDTVTINGVSYDTEGSFFEQEAKEEEELKVANKKFLRLQRAIRENPTKSFLDEIRQFEHEIESY